ncbi:hypothetical protein CLV63_11326 [Murinocardiopsis flavida]|uniref:Uncharacterized protein n=1 Tax=Murinocardiopsis flavida TaxID=645275 RepID=A0A2P8DF71_9ACTN|nr:alkaline shock response membrane anchor protein AmaP [Murinocardiopsis flavida]PSK95863.1 hypothetical protein CLV63_11326 [Murinocardiopsis flavida]
MAAAAGNRARRTARGNRWFLALLGLVLMAAGGAALAAGLGGFSGLAASETLGDSVGGRFGRPWVPYAAAAVAAVVALSALRLLAVQVRTGTVARLSLERDTGPGTTEMPASAARRVLIDEIGRYPGVRGVRAHLTGPGDGPAVRLALTLDADADTGGIWRRVRSEGLADLRTSLELDRLPAVLRISMAPPPKVPPRTLA